MAEKPGFLLNLPISFPEDHQQINVTVRTVIAPGLRTKYNDAFYIIREPFPKLTAIFIQPSLFLGGLNSASGIALGKSHV